MFTTPFSQPEASMVQFWLYLRQTTIPPWPLIVTAGFSRSSFRSVKTTEEGFWRGSEESSNSVSGTDGIEVSFFFSSLGRWMNVSFERLHTWTSPALQPLKWKTTNHVQKLLLRFAQCSHLFNTTFATKQEETTFLINRWYARRISPETSPY